MKLIIFLFFVAFITVSQAKVWRVDNNVSNKPDFTNLQLAHDGANAGDTLYIAGHGLDYGPLEISKQIVLIGTGYFLDKNLDNGVNPFEARIGEITFRNGAENSIVISCSVTAVQIQCNNIILKRDKVYAYSGNRYSVYTAINRCSGIIVQQCFIKCGISIEGDNSRIVNNFILGSTSPYLGSQALYISSSGLIKNNVISGYHQIWGMVVENNIFEVGIYYLIDCINRNNIGGDMNTVFTYTGNEDAKYILKDGSPAKGAGANGVDCGMFGGDEPYILSGIPPIPMIYEAIVPSTVTNKDGLSVKIKVKTNN